MTNYEQYLAAPDPAEFLEQKRQTMIASTYELFFQGLVTECLYLRKQAYPPLEQQMDMLYHQGYDAWRTCIEQIKLRYPKPQE